MHWLIHGEHIIGTACTTKFSADITGRSVRNTGGIGLSGAIESDILSAGADFETNVLSCVWSETFFYVSNIRCSFKASICN